MEPFDLSLNQVNFEEEAFGDSDELHSFSNLVSYDSDFKEDRSEGFPVRSRRIKQYEVADSFHFSQVNHMARVMDESKINVVGQAQAVPAHKGAVIEEAIAGFDEDLNDSTKSKAALKISDSFKAFTETVEALALQKSVIGKRNLVPASADEVARVVAETRARLSKEHRQMSSDSLAETATLPSRGSDADSVTYSEDSFPLANSSPTTHPEELTASVLPATSAQPGPVQQMGKINDHPSSSKAKVSESHRLVEINSHNVFDSSSAVQPLEGGRNPGRVKIDPDNLPLRKMVEAKNTVTETISFGSRQSLEGFGILSSTVSEQGTSTSAGSPSRIPERKELIRISPKEMSTAATKKSPSSWFWSKSSPEVTSPKQEDSRRTQAIKNADHEEAKNHPKRTTRHGASSSVDVRENSSSDANQILQLAQNTSSGEHSSAKFERNRVEINSSESGKIAPADGLNQMASMSPGAQNPEVNSTSNFESRAGGDASPQHSSGEYIRNDSYKMDTTSSSLSLNSVSHQRGVLSGKSEEFQQTLVSASQTSSAPVVTEIYHKRPIHDTMSWNSDVGGRRVSRQDSLDSTISGSKDDLQLRLEQILKEKVKLEGQVEVLEAEGSALLKDRAELQTRVAALMQELQSREKTRVGLAGDRDALSADLETLRQNRARLEAVIIDAHKLLEDKDQELRTLENDLELAKDAGEKHLDQLKSFQMEVKSRDATITDLKTKITELYVEFQTTNQNRILADNEVGSLQGELKSMAAAKEWYKDQLQFSQREKSELQAEVTRVKAEMIAQGTAIERLKADNQRTKRQLAESEQRSLNEKQTLARHLESIEADMMEREAAFAQMQKERQNVNDAQNESTEDEVISVLREDLSKATSELKRSQGQVNVLQHEQKELIKRLALSQESILERDKAIDSLEKSVVEIESQLKQTQLEFTTRLEEIERLEHDRTVLQMELKSAKEEKEVFDSSLRSLKDDMSVVEKSFRLMKQELLTKQSDLDRLKAEMENNGTGLEIFPERKSSEQLHEISQGFEFSPIHSIVRSLTKYQSSETQTDGEPEDAIGDGCDAIDNKVDSEVLKRLEEEKQSAEKQLVAVQQLLETADTERQQLSKNLLSVEQELVVLRERSLDLELKLQQSYEEKETIQHNLVEERFEVDEKQRASADRSEEELVQLQTENNNLRSKLGDLQRESHKEIAKQKTKALKLGKQLEMALKEHHETCRLHDQRVEELNQRLATLEETNTKIEGELANAHQRAALDQDDRTSQMHLELQRLTEELEAVQNARHSTETELNQVILRNQSEIDDYRMRFVQLETELQSARNYIEERRVADAETANLALELEREKGRLAGFIRSHSTLKEHASLLEASLANKESSVVQMSSEVEDLLQARNRQIQDLTEQVHLLEEGLAKAQQNTKDARKQLMTEKGNHIKVRRELEQLSIKHSQLVDEVELLRKDLSKMTEDAEAAKNDQVAQKMKMEQLLSEMKTVRLERDRMSRDLEDREARDGTLHEQIQSLEWKLSQKVAEMTAAEEKAQLVDERRQAEASGLNQSLQASTSELYLVRDELATTKHEKAELKARVTQLRQVLMSIIEQCTKATEAGKAITIQMIMDKDELQKLLEESSAPPIQSKPLSFLQATLNGLRGEISSLQVQVNEHTSVVQNSSQAWRQLEAQMEDLRQVCKSSAAQRAASDKLLMTTEELSQLPPMADIQMALQLPSTGPLVLPGSMVNIIKTTSSSSSSTFSRTEIVENEQT